ncbi:hypothetical protein EUX98_g9038 [Antrodiella citrinella]|uniref:3'-5' exonuclease n=1 Tax=Antrodiella citrinella TaxID=2447956 RepID=A0A4S4M0J9_9APHY|nr:hypothetical protein EUX98_g9038 [Antrodiella citrinella]
MPSSSNSDSANASHGADSAPTVSNVKRCVGRPKGSRNKASAGSNGRPVGRPRGSGKRQQQSKRARYDSSSDVEEVRRTSTTPSVTITTDRIFVRGTATPTTDRSGTRTPSSSHGVAELASPPTALREHAGEATSSGDNPGNVLPPFLSVDDDAALNSLGLAEPADMVRGLGDQDESEEAPFEDDDELGGDDDEDEDFAPPSDDDDEDNNNTTAGPSQARTGQHAPRSTMPTWLITDYKDRCTQLGTEIRRNISKRPTCYEQGQFEITPKLPIFYTQGVHQITPAMFYQPRYFVWHPHHFCKILCPPCKAAGRKLQNGMPVTLALCEWPRAPRRVVDVEHNLYIIGYRYQCTQCKKRYKSWSPAVMKQLPPPVVMQFKFHLTHRSGLSPSPFAALIRNLHRGYYEDLVLQYYEQVKIRHESAAGQILALHSRFGDCDDCNGYADYVPSGRYFRGFYDNFIESHAKELDQRMAMLSADILQIDHSFKVPKHLGKVCGEAVFSALHTTLNNYGEIRHQVLTPNKAHDQYMPALALIPQSCHQYGHDPPKLVYTDNVRGDKAELERAIPSLLDDVRAIPAHSVYPHLEIPSSWTVRRLESEYQVKIHMQFLLTELTEAESGELVVAMDMEWPFDRSSGMYGNVAMLSIAYNTTIYLMRLVVFSKKNGKLYLPGSLLTVLRSSRIKKVGVNIRGDLTRLFNDCGFSASDTPFEGDVSLGVMARDRDLTDKATIGLADLSTMVLRRFLPKEESIRISTTWDDPNLPPHFWDYAALDVYASWAIYDVLNAVPSAEEITETTRGGTSVKLLASDRKTVVAYGFIAPDRPVTFDRIRVTKTRAVVNITSIMCPSYLLRPELTGQGKQVPLSQMGEGGCPFGLLCRTKDLRPCVSDYEAPPTRPTHASTSQPTPAISMGSDLTLYTLGDGDEDEDAAPVENLGPEGDDDNDDNDSFDSLAWLNTHLNHVSAEEQRCADSVPDVGALQAANDLATRLQPSSSPNLPETVSPSDESSLTYQDTDIQSRVLGDHWHLMDQFKIPKNHGLRIPFFRALRDSLLIPDLHDKAAVEEVLAKRPGKPTWDSYVCQKPDWVWQRVKRFSPRSGVLFQRVLEVVKTYGPLKDASTGQPVFNDSCWKKAENVLENIRMGFYSDPLQIPLYQVNRKDKDGLPIYKCVRGTNGVEGGVHQNVIRRFAPFNASARLTVNILREYCSEHNLTVGTLNRTGKPYRGSLNVWTRNKIASLVDYTSDAFKVRSVEPTVVGWVNGDEYEESKETFGILPFSEAMRKKFGMESFHSQYAADKKILHFFLAKLQNTRVAVVPVHTSSERSLFRLMMKEHSDVKCFGAREQPNWVMFTTAWANRCDGIQIFYKLPEHLKAYYQRWLERRNEENSIEQCRAAYNEITSLLKPDPKAIPSIPTRRPLPLKDAVIKGKAAERPPQVDNSVQEPICAWQIGQLLSRTSSAQTQSHFQYYYAAPVPVGLAGPGSVSASRKRAFDQSQQAFAQSASFSEQGPAKGEHFPQFRILICKLHTPTIHRIYNICSYDVYKSTTKVQTLPS